MTTYYVDDATGNDADDGLSEANAWKTINKAGTTAAVNDLVNVKNTNDYTVTSAQSIAAGMLLRGYTTTPGDNGIFTLKTSTDSIGLLNIGANGVTLRNFHLKHQASTTRGLGIYTPSADRLGLTLQNFAIEGCSRGVDSDFVVNFEFYNACLMNGRFIDCTVFGATFRQGVSFNDILFRGNAEAVRLLVNNHSPRTFNRCQFVNSTNDGIRLNASVNTTALVFDGCVFRNNGGNGVNIVDTGATKNLLFATNSVFYGNGGKGLEADAALVHLLRKCAFRSNTGGNYNTTYFLAHNIIDEITLTADPHTDHSTFDYSPNNVAGGGALLRAAGFSGDYGGAGYLDVGGKQHQDSGGGNLIVIRRGGLVTKL